MGLSAIRAATAGDGLYDFDLFAGTGVLDKVPDVDNAVQTDVRRFVGRWVWFGCGRVIHVNSSDLLAVPRGD